MGSIYLKIEMKLVFKMLYVYLFIQTVFKISKESTHMTKISAYCFSFTLFHIVVVLERVGPLACSNFKRILHAVLLSVFLHLHRPFGLYVLVS
jgi:hypothetical protein